MPLQAGKEGRFAPLFFLAILAAPAGAEEVASADLALCAAQATDELKLACFEALAAKHAQPETAAVAQPAEPTTIQAAPSVRGEEPAPEAESAGRPRLSAEPVTAAGPAASEQPSSPAAPEPRPLDDSIGQQHLGSDAVDHKKEREIIIATITTVVQDPRTRKLTFEMTNGQVWRQMQRGHFLYPKNKAFDVEIRRGLMGDYQMRVDGAGRMTRIVRVR